jgi:hypothetical protein
MELTFKTTEEKAAYYRLLFEILLALAKITTKTPTDIRAVENVEQLFYSVIID